MKSSSDLSSASHDLNFLLLNNPLVTEVVGPDVSSLQMFVGQISTVVTLEREPDSCSSNIAQSVGCQVRVVAQIQELADHSDLFEIASTPGAHKQVQFQLHLFEKIQAPVQ